MKDSKKILIIGNKCHGKTTFANMIKKHSKSAEAFSTSSYLVYRLSLLNGVSEEEILNDKEKYRPELIKLGNAMCEADAGCLVSICLWSSHEDLIIIDGVRRMSEYSRVSDWFDEIIWINRPAEPLGQDNLELDESHGTITIMNEGSLEDLEKKAVQFIEKVGLS